MTEEDMVGLIVPDQQEGGAGASEGLDAFRAAQDGTDQASDRADGADADRGRSALDSGRLVPDFDHAGVQSLADGRDHEPSRPRAAQAPSEAEPTAGADAIRTERAAGRAGDDSGGRADTPVPGAGPTAEPGRETRPQPPDRAGPAEPEPDLDQRFLALGFQGLNAQDQLLRVSAQLNNEVAALARRQDAIARQVEQLTRALASRQQNAQRRGR
jgi:hypothetical protein